AIDRLVQTTVGRITPQCAGHRDEYRVAVSLINCNPSDAFRFLQASGRPCFATVGGFVNSIANRHAVARPRFTSADPNVFGILRVECERPDRLHSLFVKYRPIPRSAVVGFPNAATSRTDEERDLARRLAHSGDARDPSAHCR